VTLIRISFGPIKVEGLRLGEGRYLTTFEAKTLRKAAGL
jgi:16S rRNA U516 pseudouridylate synthase RsuA-like enzyme